MVKSGGGGGTAWAAEAATGEGTPGVPERVRVRTHPSTLANRTIVRHRLAAAAAPRVDGTCQNHSAWILTQRGYKIFCITLLQPLRAWTALARTTAPGF